MLGVPENSVTPTAGPNARFVAPDLASGAESIAQGAQGLAHGMEVAEGNLDDLGKMYDQAAVKKADAEDVRQIAEIRATAMTATGFDAQTAVKEARDQITQIRQSRLAALHNPRQRDMYSEVFDTRAAAMEGDFTAHLITQTRAAEKEASGARADSYADLATQTFGTKAFDANLDTALSEVANVNAGAGADVIGRKQAVARSAIVSKSIEQLIADPEHADIAKDAIDKYAANGLLPEDETKLRKELNPILKDNQTDGDAGWAFTDAAIPSTGEPTTEHPSESPTTPPRPQITTPADTHVGAPVSPTDPLRGKGTVTNTAAQHRARGSGNALDIAAPAGTPIYTPMSGKVLKNWWDAKGGWSILVQHPNGYVTGYAHLRSQSALTVGADVDPNIPIGSVGATGDATGPHVHYTVRESSTGAKVDPAAALWGKGSVKPDSVAWKEAAPIKYTAEENGGLDRALSRLHDRASTENWSPSRYENAVTRVRQVAGVQTDLYNQQAEAKYNTAITTVVGLGDKFTKTSQIPGFGLLKPTQQYSLQQIAEGNAKAAEGGGIKANGDRFLALYGMAHDPAFRQQFLGVDLGKEAGITPGERTELWGAQIKLKQEPNGALAASMDAANALANRYLPSKNFDAGRRRLFMDRFAAAVERQQTSLGRPLTPREQDDTARALTVQVVHDGTQQYGFETQGGALNFQTEFDRIAPDIRQGIADRLASEGRPHSPREVVAEWLRSRSR